MQHSSKLLKFRYTSSWLGIVTSIQNVAESVLLAGSKPFPLPGQWCQVQHKNDLYNKSIIKRLSYVLKDTNKHLSKTFVIIYRLIIFCWYPAVIEILRHNICIFQVHTGYLTEGTNLCWTLPYPLW